MLPPLNGPVEDARQFREELVGQLNVFTPVEALGEPQEEKAACQSAARVTADEITRSTEDSDPNFS